MLVLRRVAGQAVVLTLPSGETITVALMSAKGGRASLGFQAPADVRIDRAENAGRPKVARNELTREGV